MAESPISNFYRSERTTKLIATEGLTEKLIVQYLKHRFPPPTTIYIHPEDLHGGNPHEIITKAINYIRNRDYIKQYIYIDSDKPIKTADITAAKESKFEFVYNYKCGESTLLQLIKPNFNWNNHPSLYCKTELRRLVGNVYDIASYIDNVPNTIIKNCNTTVNSQTYLPLHQVLRMVL